MTSLSQNLSSGAPIFLSSVFIAGVLSFFSPCTFPMMPVYIGLLTETAGKKDKWRAVLKSLLFVLGLSTTFVTLGLGAGALGRFFSGDWWTIIGGLFVILLGLHQMEVVKLPGLQKYRVLRISTTNKGELFSAFLLGLTFSFGWTPCVGPVLGAVLVVTSQGGQVLYGGFLMLVYTLGLSLPFLVLALLSNVLLEKMQKMEGILPIIKKVGGALIVLMGLLLLLGQMNQLTIFANKLF